MRAATARNGTKRGDHGERSDREVSELTRHYCPACGAECASCSGSAEKQRARAAGLKVWTTSRLGIKMCEADKAMLQRNPDMTFDELKSIREGFTLDRRFNRNAFRRVFDATALDWHRDRKCILPESKLFDPVDKEDGLRDPYRVDRVHIARMICNGEDRRPMCPVRAQCLAWAQANQGSGVYGGQYLESGRVQDVTRPKRDRRKEVAA